VASTSCSQSLVLAKPSVCEHDEGNDSTSGLSCLLLALKGGYGQSLSSNLPGSAIDYPKQHHSQSVKVLQHARDLLCHLRRSVSHLICSQHVTLGCGQIAVDLTSELPSCNVQHENPLASSFINNASSSLRILCVGGGRCSGPWR
jgi:hypothetical protein